MGRGRATGLADPNANPEQKQLQERSRRAAKGCKAGPDHEANGDDIDPALLLGDPRNRNAQDRVEQRKGDTAQEANLRVGQVQINLDRLAQRTDDGSVDKVAGIDGDKDP